MNTIHRDQLIHQLQWRYATKQFDPQRKISAADWLALEEALVLTPSSYGLQPWKFIVITDQAMKEKLVPVSWGQRQPADCSHFVVFAIQKDLDEADVDAHIRRIAEVRNVSVDSLAGFRDIVVGNIVKAMDATARNHWAERQVYIALGNFMTSAALLGIDTCPMEGIVPAQYNEILGLGKDGLGTVCAAAAGYRAAGDKYATARKVRFPKDEVIRLI
ncbi:MAG TPA: NAD(P)H-dependent oxidoreductase [Verrucomicrobiae bacterium]|nr:NAD(P)H-dependent oxidoreductase [Verrucomicrobiae bacterium]